MIRPVGIQKASSDVVALEPLARYAERIGLRASLIVGFTLGLLILLLNADRDLIPMLEDRRSFGPLSQYFMIPAAFFRSRHCLCPGHQGLERAGSLCTPARLEGGGCACSVGIHRADWRAGYRYY